MPVSFFRFVSPLFLVAALLSASGALAPATARGTVSWNDEPPLTRPQRVYLATWAKALDAQRKGRTAKAIALLEKARGGDSLASLYRSVTLAGLYGVAGGRERTARADSLLAELIRDDRGGSPVWTRHLYRLRLRTSAVLAPAARAAFLEAALAAPLEKPERTEALYQLLELDTAAVPRAVRAAHLRQLVPLALSGPRLTRVYDAWRAAQTPADTTWEDLRLLLDVEERLEDWGAAVARARALRERAPSPGAARAMQARIARYLYNAGDYDKAIREYDGLRARYGDTPEILIQIARAHRALSRAAETRAAYARLVDRFPRDSRAAETLWMYAFDDEMEGRTDTALAAYARIAHDFPASPRSSEAELRRGLIRYRGADFRAAAAAFATLRGTAERSRITGAARYWEGKALAGAGDTSAARTAWASLAAEYPFGHYGHMARRDLARLGGVPDTLEWTRFLNRATGDSLAAWLATVLPGGAAVPQGFGESAWLPVSRLFGMGLDTLAVLTLQARADAAPANLWLLYDAAVRCRAAGFGYEAYRFGLRLSDRLPLERWPDAPVDVLRLFYPPSYAELIRPAAARAGVSPALVMALIKQESGFDPNAVSRVGARGLMQLMPSTGAQQARREGMNPFHPDSLFAPAVNVELGVAYLRDVLRRHDGHIDWALAHYNAGPTALARWMPRLRDRPSEDAVEDIGYAETREYVKRVGANYRTYRVLWDEWEDGKTNDE